MKKLILAVALALIPLRGMAVTTSSTLTNQAVNAVWTVDLQSLGVNSLSAQATYSSATIAGKTFTDGAPSAGVITVGSTSGLSAAAASDVITITSTSGIAGAYVIAPGFQLRCGADWSAGPTVSSAATSLAAALNSSKRFTAIAVAGVITITANTTGAWANSIPFASSNANVVVTSALMTGGVDAAVVTVHGVKFVAGKDWTVGGNVTAAALSLSNAIAAAPQTGNFLTSSPSAGVITLASRSNGSVYNFGLASSVAGITISGALMTGGSDMNYALSSKVVNIAAHGFSTGLPVLYTEASGAPVAPLVTGTTYFVGVVDADHISLATTSALAVAGTFVTITSSNSPSHVYTLAPVAISGTATLTWNVSADGVNFSALPGADVVSFASPFTSGVKLWDLGDLNYRYVRLAVVAPTTGAINVATTVTGFAPSDYVRKAGSMMTGILIEPFPYTQTTAQLNVSTPSAVGQQVFNSTLGVWCQGHGSTTAGDWELVSSTGTACH